MASVVRTYQAIGYVLAALILCGAAGEATAQDAAPATAAQAQFSSPEAAVQAVTTALAKDDTDALVEIFGRDHAVVVLGPDAASGRVIRDRAADMLRQNIKFRREGPNKIVLVAENGWPMPIPLTRHDNKWTFDTAAGEQEILARRIGEDELAAISTLRAFVSAEHRYAEAHRTPGQPALYAAYVQSTPGETDGLWWDAATASKAGPSPLAHFADENAAFLQDRTPGDPFRGYFFRILTAQGPHAHGGARSYLRSDGSMAGGFAMIAWPASWREGGVMTFLVGPDGKVLQQDFGPDTQTAVNAINAYDPNPEWQLVGP